MESEIRAEVSEEGYQIREKTILEQDGPFPSELAERLTQLLKVRNFRDAIIVLDQWRFSRLSPTEQKREQRWHRRNARLLKREGLPETMFIQPDDLIAPNNPYLDPKFAR